LATGVPARLVMIPFAVLDAVDDPREVGLRVVDVELRTGVGHGDPLS
jgi:hypothetical protein